MSSEVTREFILGVLLIIVFGLGIIGYGIWKLLPHSTNPFEASPAGKFGILLSIYLGSVLLIIILELLRKESGSR